MCGRYGRTTAEEELDLPISWNIAPTEDVLATASIIAGGLPFMAAISNHFIASGGLLSRAILQVGYRVELTKKRLNPVPAMLIIGPFGRSPCILL